jgi:hypothetical protein
MDIAESSRRSELSGSIEPTVTPESKLRSGNIANLTPLYQCIFNTGVVWNRILGLYLSTTKNEEDSGGKP